MSPEGGSVSSFLVLVLGAKGREEKGSHKKILNLRSLKSEVPTYNNVMRMDGRLLNKSPSHLLSKFNISAFLPPTNFSGSLSTSHPPKQQYNGLSSIKHP
jgi:hypothetical protein